MARTEMIVRIFSDQRWRQFQSRQQAAACRRVRSGVKNIEGRICNKTFKIKQSIAVPKNVQVNLYVSLSVVSTIYRLKNSINTINSRVALSDYLNL